MSSFVVRPISTSHYDTVECLSSYESESDASSPSFGPDGEFSPLFSPNSVSCSPVSSSPSSNVNSQATTPRGKSGSKRKGPAPPPELVIGEAAIPIGTPSPTIQMEQKKRKKAEEEEEE